MYLDPQHWLDIPGGSHDGPRVDAILPQHAEQLIIVQTVNVQVPDHEARLLLHCSVHLSLSFLKYKK